MVRDFTVEAVDPAVIERMLDAASPGTERGLRSGQGLWQWE